MAPLVAGRAYRLYGWSDDNGWSASAVTFTLAEVGRLKPGQVLHRSDRSDTAGAAEANEVSTVAEFTSKACARNQP